MEFKFGRCLSSTEEINVTLSGPTVLVFVSSHRSKRGHVEEVEVLN